VVETARELGTIALHDAALVRIWCSALILPQMRCSLLDEIAGFVETDAISLSIADRLTNTEVIRLSSVAVPRRTFQLLNRFLFELWHCLSLALLV
jgi:hypothetical protein